MLTRLNVRSDVNITSLALSLQDAANGYIVKDIQGLDPVKATITSSPFAGLDGEQFQASRREARNIVMTIGIEAYSGGATVEELRRALYSYFLPKRTVTLTFYFADMYGNIPAGSVRQIEGQVESFETALFSKDPEIAISIMCFDPNFSGGGTYTVNGNTTSGSTEQTIEYDGTVETGFKFELNVNRAMSDFVMTVRRPNSTQESLTFAMSLLNGDKVTINTDPKNKYATLLRGGVESSVLYAVAPTSKWPKLYPGENYLRVLVSGASVPYVVTHAQLHGGL